MTQGTAWWVVIAIAVLVPTTASAGTSPTSEPSPATTTRPGPADPALDRLSAAMSAPRGRMAEATIAVDPRDPAHLAVAADPYLDPTRIQVAQTYDGGRTWSPPRTVRPAGFSRSFDPGLAFAADGSLLIAGGAARTGPRGCLPESMIFVARLAGARLSYERVTGPERGAFLDRPSFAYDRRTGMTAVSWTRSSGPRAHCLAEPVKAQTWLAWRRGEGEFHRQRLASRDPAVFGSHLAITQRGRIILAVAGWRADRRQNVVISEIEPGKGTTSAILRAGRRPVLLPRPRMPLNLFIPTVTIGTDDRRTAVWTETDRTGQRVRVATSPDGRSWKTRGGPPTGNGPPLAPTVAYGSDGVLYLVQGALASGRVRFTVWREAARGWSPVRELGGAPADGWRELGQALGIATGPSGLAVAVPTGDGRRSRLTVLVHPLTTTPKPADQSSRPTTELLPRRPDSVLPAVGVLLAASTAGLALYGSFRCRRRRSAPDPHYLARP